MKTILLILLCLIVSPISVGSSTVKNTTFVENDDAMEKVVYKLNSLETSLNTLNENLIKLDSLR